MRIGELAKATGHITQTIRFYESQGLLPPPARTESGYRIYGEGEVVRLRFISKAKRVGLSLDEVTGILELHDRSEPTCLHVRSLLDDKLVEVNHTIDDLRAFRDEITRLRDESGTLDDCKPKVGAI